MKRLLCALVLVGTFGCAGFPNPDPPEETFTQADLAVWQESRQAPSELIGTWRSVEITAAESGELTWYRFGEDGLFVAAKSPYFEQQQGVPLWEGAFRVNDAEVVCHYQRKNGDDSWIEAQGGKGEVKRYSYTFNDNDTLVLGGQTSQSLVVKFKRVNIQKPE